MHKKTTENIMSVFYLSGLQDADVMNDKYVWDKWWMWDMCSLFSTDSEDDLIVLLDLLLFQQGMVCGLISHA